jgi:hypothetical protein
MHGDVFQRVCADIVMTSRVAVADYFALRAVIV